MLFELTEIIFENRNKLYGAYYLRKNYHKALTIGFLTNLPLILLLALDVKFFSKSNSPTTSKPQGQEFMLQVQEVELQDINFEETPILLLPQTPPPPKNETEPQKNSEKNTENNQEISVVEDITQNKTPQNEKGSTSTENKPNKDTLPNSTSSESNHNEPAQTYSPDMWSVYVKKNLRYPPQALRERKECNVFVAVVIDETGKMEIDKERANFSCEEYFNEEVRRLIANAPRFIVFDASGKPQKKKLMLKIPFELPKN
ncbi:energy transducer TonB [Raineya orbicola]|jgi:protein TonB|uniref:Gram-negative bacterial tonB protein n=1 Tax=Raineya orbicola TaxID=2016530 RepID=A0A2N3IK08_9BACT|nr:energy transducer TonB [Raineya orbicola]PKQ70670.1 Gram-negative bacterial tonB protein [Raineya orbicola]